MKKHRWTAVFAAGLAAFTVFISLDTFVLSSAYQTGATEMNTAMFNEIDESEVGDEGASETDEKVLKTDNDAVKTEGDTSETAENTQETAENTQENAGNTLEKSDENSSENEKSGRKSRHHKPGSRKPGSTSGKGAGTGDGSGSGSGEETGKKPETATGSDSGSTDISENAGTAVNQYSDENTGTAVNQYSDENTDITVNQYTVNGTAVYVADVKLSSAQYLKTAFAEDTYGKNVTEKTSEIASSHNAVLAINGDYYGTQETGYVIRNGVVYRDTAGKSDVLCIYADGTMKVVDPSEYTAQELVEQGVWQAFSFGPALLESGEIAVSEETEVGKAMSSNPRTSIGIIDDLHYVFVVSDGRTDESEGLSLYELASFMEQLGVRTAYNLDGGGSSTMYFDGDVINNPTTNGKIKERSVSDIVYI